MAGLLGNFSEPQGGLLSGDWSSFGQGLQNAFMNPMTLGGLALLSGEGMNGALRGMQVGGSFQDQRRQLAEQEQKKQQFAGLLADPSVTSAIPAPMLRIAEMAGPSGGPEMLGKFIDPAREADLSLKRAQIAKMQRDNALASEAAARQKALYNAFMTPPAGPAPAPVPPSSNPPTSGAARFSAPGLAAPPSANPQTAQDIFNALPPNKRAQAQMALASGDMEEFRKIIGEGPPQLADNLTPGEKRVDQTFAKTYEDFVLSGGAADVSKNLSQLRGVHKDLTSKDGPNLTGPLLGLMPDFVTSITHPQAVNTREQVEEVVQRNLRIILGAQFTQKEGDRLIARAYNPRLSEAENAKRLGRLIVSMDRAAKAKLAAADYFERNGTMKGYRGSTSFNLADIEADIDGGTDLPANGSDWSIKRID